MEKSGYVVQASEGKAKIRIHRESSCGGDCGRCGGCGSDEVVIETENSLNLKAGETVKVIMDNKKFLRRAALGYGSLVAVMILGGILGYEIFQSEAASVLFVAGFLAITLLVLKRSFKGKTAEIRIERE